MAARARAQPETLNIEEQQIAIDFFDDPAYTWHARILLRRLGSEADGRWIAVTPDGEVQVLSLGDHRVQVLPRNSPYPARVRDHVYGFDRGPDGGLEHGLLSGWHGEAQALAAIYGDRAIPSQVSASWYFSDPASDEFATEVDLALVRDPQRMVVREAVALVHTEEGWATAERVLARDLDEWKRDKRDGAGRDPRVLPVTRDAREHRFVALREAMIEMKAPLAKEADFPYEGPLGITELLASVRGSGEEIGGFHEFWARDSGVPSECGAARSHRTLLTILAHMIHFDQLNAFALSSAECVARHVLQIHRAARKNPKAPDFKGLAVMVHSKLDTGGQTHFGEFAKWTAARQKDEAFTMQQQRLYAEESSKTTAQGGGGKKG